MIAVTLSPHCSLVGAPPSAVVPRRMFATMRRKTPSVGEQVPTGQRLEFSTPRTTHPSPRWRQTSSSSPSGSASPSSSAPAAATSSFRPSSGTADPTAKASSSPPTPPAAPAHPIAPSPNSPTPTAPPTPAPASPKPDPRQHRGRDEPPRTGHRTGCGVTAATRPHSDHSPLPSTRLAVLWTGAIFAFYEDVRLIERKGQLALPSHRHARRHAHNQLDRPWAAPDAAGPGIAADFVRR